eukprot:jgi/Chrpa1/16799/Chrysochromulina_OHIO_Genome00003840-RA
MDVYNGWYWGPTYPLVQPAPMYCMPTGDWRVAACTASAYRPAWGASVQKSDAFANSVELTIGTTRT